MINQSRFYPNFEQEYNFNRLNESYLFFVLLDKYFGIFPQAAWKKCLYSLERQLPVADHMTIFSATNIF